MSKVKQGEGFATIRNNNHVARVSVRIGEDGLHNYHITIGSVGPRESVKGSMGKIAAGLARVILAKYETQAKKSSSRKKREREES